MKENSTNDTGQVWLVTGCSSGFGRALVSTLLAKDRKVVATFRQVPNETDWTEHGDNVKCIQLDVTDSEHIIQERVKEIICAFGRIDVVVNNAGFVLSSVLEETSQEDLINQFKTNFFGSLSVTRAVLPHLRANRGGTILFMGSIAGWKGTPTGGPYGSSKSALEGAVECLDREVCGFGIRVHLLILGRFRTNILNATNKKSNLDSIKGIGDYSLIKEHAANYHSSTNGFQPGDPIAATERIIEIIDKKNIPDTGSVPMRIPLGSDAVQVMRLKCQETLALLDNWADFAGSTDFVGTVGAPSFIR